MTPKWDGKERRSTMFDQDFYDRMMEMHTDVKYMRAWAKEHDESDDRTHDRLDRRIKTLEEDRAKVIGGAGVLGIIGGFLTKWFLK